MADLKTLRDNAVDGQLGPSDIVNGIIWSSGDETNVVQGSTYKGCEVEIVYHDMQSTGGLTFSAIVEAKASNGAYIPVGHQFNEFWQTGKEIIHTIDLNPDTFWADAGTPNVIFPGRLLGYVSPQQFTLPSTFRVCILANEPTGSALTSLDVSVYLEYVNEI